jgi:hypothetical protein
MVKGQRDDLYQDFTPARKEDPDRGIKKFSTAAGKKNYFLVPLLLRWRWLIIPAGSAPQGKPTGDGLLFYPCGIPYMGGKEFLHGTVKIKPVFFVSESMAFVILNHIFHDDSTFLQRFDHLV